jgi:hypothetical protein
VPGGKRQIEPLAAVDHAALTYEEFYKDFYEEASEIGSMAEADVLQYRRYAWVQSVGCTCKRCVGALVGV